MFALIYSSMVNGSGFHELVGLYSTEEKAEEAKVKDMKKNVKWKYGYKIEEIKINTEVNITYDKW